MVVVAVVFHDGKKYERRVSPYARPDQIFKLNREHPKYARDLWYWAHTIDGVDKGESYEAWRIEFTQRATGQLSQATAGSS